MLITNNSFGTAFGGIALLRTAGNIDTRLVVAIAASIAECRRRAMGTRCSERKTFAYCRRSRVSLSSRALESLQKRSRKKSTGLLPKMKFLQSAISLFCLSRRAVIAIFMMLALVRFPLPLAQMPSAIFLIPLGTLIDIARAFSDPMAIGPHMGMPVPVPIARGPDIAAAWGRYAFITQWRWLASDIDVDTDLRCSLQRQGGRRADQYCGNQGERWLHDGFPDNDGNQIYSGICKAGEIQAIAYTCYGSASGHKKNGPSGPFLFDTNTISISVRRTNGAVRLQGCPCRCRYEGPCRSRNLRCAVRCPVC